MANPYFKFKQFTIQHDRCAMKVGTDGVLLGAYVSHTDPTQILDIGTGSGLVALMLAQRFPQASITGVEIDENAARQAAENVVSSPFAKQVKIIHTSLQDFVPNQAFDLIVCNPPFFKVSSQSHLPERNTARQTGQLTPEEIFDFSRIHLAPNGQLSLIFPAETNLEPIANQYGLKVSDKLLVRGSSSTLVKRIIWTFSATEVRPTASELILEESRNHYTPEFKALVRDFYLNL